MKIAWTVLFLTMSLFVACGPAAQPEARDAEAQTLPSSQTGAVGAETSPIPTPTGQVAVVSLDSPLATPPSEVVIPDDFEVQWNPDPSALVVSATFCCGFAPELVPLNYIPDALIWGDGRILWVERNDLGQRRVLQGQLTLEQMAGLLQRAVEAGFFGWQDLYANQGVADAADQCLSITVGSQTKRVCEYFGGAPPAFHALYDYLAAGAEVNGVDYVPPRGYLTAYPLDATGNPPPLFDSEWPSDSLGFSLGEALDGVWVEGEILQAAWAVVNNNSWGNIVQEGDAYYQISIQVPGLSLVEPPAQ
ncbi:MAG: hypothetical protein ACE5H9_15395 [Anaerolineae bacterium]